MKISSLSADFTVVIISDLDILSCVHVCGAGGGRGRRGRGRDDDQEEASTRPSGPTTLFDFLTEKIDLPDKKGARIIQLSHGVKMFVTFVMTLFSNVSFISMVEFL